jgi:hypothetical protein
MDSTGQSRTGILWVRDWSKSTYTREVDVIPATGASYYCAIYARASIKNTSSWKIQNKYFYSPYSNEILYTKALEYKEYFTPIDLLGIPKSSRDIQDFLDVKFRIVGQAVSKYMIVSVCVMFWRHLTPRVRNVILWGFQWWLSFNLKGGVNTCRDKQVAKLWVYQWRDIWWCYANISVFIDREINRFLKKWIMTMIWYLHSMTKLSGWLRHLLSIQ